jgi:hypothetical protein
MNEDTTKTNQETAAPGVAPAYKRQDRRGGRGRNSRPPRSMVGPKFDTTVSTKRETDHIPPLKDGDIRVIHLRRCRGSRAKHEHGRIQRYDRDC